jgi:hypothetical protein
LQDTESGSRPTRSESTSSNFRGFAHLPMTVKAR